MPWTVDRSAGYEASLKQLTKRFRHAAKNIDDEFKINRPKSDPMPGFSSLLWKARVASSDLGKGKSHSFRVIYFWDEQDPDYCCLGACYFKGDYENPTVEEARQVFVTVKARLERFREEKRKTAGKSESVSESKDDPGL